MANFKKPKPHFLINLDIYANLSNPLFSIHFVNCSHAKGMGRMSITHIVCLSRSPPPFSLGEYAGAKGTITLLIVFPFKFFLKNIFLKEICNPYAFGAYPK